MNTLADGNLTVTSASPRTGLIRLDWRGRSDSRSPGDALQPYLLNALDEARRNHADLALHFESLDYLNSSTVAVLVQFLHRARAAGVALTFSYRASLRWQKLSFEALRVFEQIDSLIRVVPAEEAQPS